MPIVALLVGVCAHFALRNTKRVRLIDETPTSTVRQLTPGLAEVAGRVVALGRRLEAPMSGCPCVYYHFQVQERRSSGRSGHWVTVIDDRKIIEFGVDDGTGTALVDLPG